MRSRPRGADLGAERSDKRVDRGNRPKIRWCNLRFWDRQLELGLDMKHERDHVERGEADITEIAVRRYLRMDRVYFENAAHKLSHHILRRFGNHPRHLSPN